MHRHIFCAVTCCTRQVTLAGHLPRLVSSMHEYESLGPPGKDPQLLWQPRVDQFEFSDWDGTDLKGKPGWAAAPYAGGARDDCGIGHIAQVSGSSFTSLSLDLADGKEIRRVETCPSSKKFIGRVVRVQFMQLSHTATTVSWMTDETLFLVPRVLGGDDQ